MLKSEFYEYAHRVIDKCFAIMEVADKEYASDADKFANFKWQAEAEDRTPEQVGITFMLKHVRSLSRGVSIREPMEGRICDIINYILLIGGMREEAAARDVLSYTPAADSDPYGFLMTSSTGKEGC